MVRDHKPSMSHEENPFDVILCDIEMPVMDGIEFTREIRRLEAEGELEGHTPILGVTANVRSKQVSGALEVGMVSEAEPSIFYAWGLMLILNLGWGHDEAVPD